MRVWGFEISDETVARAIEAVEARGEPFKAADVAVELSRMIGARYTDRPLHWLSEVANRGLQQARIGGVLKYEKGRWVPNLDSLPESWRG